MTENADSQTASQRKFETVFEHANDAIFIVDIENDRIVNCNSAAEALVEYFSPFPDEEYVLLQYARAVATGNVTDQVHRALCSAYDPGEVVAVGLICDFYVGLCNYVASVELPFEGGEFCGWTPDDETVDALFG